NHRVGAFTAAMTLRIGLERRKIEDRKLRHKPGEIGTIRADQQLADKERVPREFGKDPGLDPVFRISAAVEILRKQLPAFRVLEKISKKSVEVFFRHLAI